jgi:hypothetical protein
LQKEISQIKALSNMSETPKVGRPMLPKKEKRGRFISTRLLPSEYDEVERAVAASGMAKTEWVRTKLVAAARRA